jgi:heat shock protein HslJ
MKTALIVTSIAALAVAIAVLHAVPLGAQSQAEKTWSLEQGRGISAAEPASRPSLRVEGQHLSGSTGCNSFTATISETGERVKIENLSLTRKLCATLQNENERAFVNALGQTQYLTKEPERITFLSDKREPLLVWTSAEPKSGSAGGGRDRSLSSPRVTQSTKRSEAADDRGNEPPKKAVAHHTSDHRSRHAGGRHAHLHGHRHGHGHGHKHAPRYGHKHAPRYGHSHRHGHYVRLRWGCDDLF